MLDQPVASDDSHIASDKQVAANRANAQLSTGPRTPEGKARSARNATRHGILASPIVTDALDGEHGCARFDAMLEGYLVYFRPRGGPEMAEVRKMVEAAWRRDQTTRFERAAAYRAWQRGIYRTLGDGRESQVLKEAELDAPTLPQEHDAMLAARYFAMSDNVYYRAQRALERLKKSRGAQLAEGAECEVPAMEPPIHFVPQPEPAPPPPAPPKTEEEELEERLRKQRDSVRRTLAEARALQSATRGEELLDAFQKQMVEQGWCFSDKARSRIDPQRLWPAQLTGGAPLPERERALMLLHAGIHHKDQPNWYCEEHREQSIRMDEEEERKERKARAERRKAARAARLGASPEQSEAAQPSESASKVVPNRADCETAREACPSGRPERSEGAQPSESGSKVVPNRADCETNPITSPQPAVEGRKNGETPPSGA